ncbi:MAG: hypothetical protein AB7D06_17085 [Pedobacter sp.]
MAENNFQVPPMTKNGNAQTESGNQGHVLIGKGCPAPRQSPMGVTIGRATFVSLDLVPQEMVQG